MRLTQEEWQRRREEVLLASKTCRTVDEIIETTQIEKNQIQTLYKKFPEEACKENPNYFKCIFG